MEASYALTRKKLQIGAFEHYKRVECLPLALISLLASIQFSFILEGRLLLAIYILLGVINLTSPFIYAWNKVKLPSCSKSITHKLILLTQSLTFESNAESNSMEWHKFYKVVTTSKGALLYLDKRSFYWIPADAEISDGTWEKFTLLLKNNIENA